MELHILGPVELRAGEQRHRLGPPRWSGVLFYLALHAGQTVTTDALMERLGTSRETVHSYIHGLRGALKRITNEVRIVRRDCGYTLLADLDQIDYHHFFHLRQQASALADEGRLADAVALLREAEQLWTGQALASQRGEWAEQTRRHLDGEKLSAIAQRIRLERRLGRTAEHVNELTRHVAESPRNEELVELLMRALHDRGQTMRALDEYRNVRQRLIDTTGLEPGRALQDLQRRLLNGDLDVPADEPEGKPTGNGAEPAALRPNNLDRTLPDFVGRRAEIEELAAAFSDPAPGIIGVYGMPGVGKSTFANHLAHKLIPSYPDAQLRLDLGAYGAEGELDPSAALARLLYMIGVSKNAMPSSLEERADLWRTHLADRHALLLLDDASGREQVRHLLPGSSPSLVIITSRHRLTGLDGITPVLLPSMPPEDSTSLLRAVLAPGQLDDEDAVRRVVSHCAGLPLAIRLVASPLRARTARTVRDLADQLDHAPDLLDAFHDDDNRSVRTSFKLSYLRLPAPRQRAFRLLSLHPGGEFTIHAAAAVLGEPIDETVRVIDLLLDHHLLEQPGRHRYRFHDLLRGYARERAEAEDDPAARTACRRRLGAYFLATAESADVLLRPFDRPERTDVPTDVDAPAPMPDAAEAQHRMELEISGMIAYAQQESRRLPGIAHAIAPYLDTTARWNEAVDLHTEAIAGWRAMHDQYGEAAATVDLSLVKLRCSQIPDAVDYARKALALFQGIGDPGGEADALDRLGLAHQYAGDHDEALACHSESAKLSQAAGDDKRVAEALAHSGLDLLFLGRYANAIIMLERALTTYRRIGDTRGQLESLNNLGEVQMRLRRREDALRSYTQSMNVPGTVERPQDRAIQLANIAKCHLELGAPDKALARFREALTIYRQIHDRIGIAEAVDGIGSVYAETGNKTEALAHYQEAIQIAREISDSPQICRTLRNTGTLHARTGDHHRALAPLEESLSVARTIVDPYELALSLDALGECLIHLGRTAEGHEHVAEAKTLLLSLGVTD